MDANSGSRLAQHISSLKHEDGQLDTATRAIELNNLVRCLTDDELRGLRIQLNGKILPNDMVARLPMELIVLIGRYLDPEDILRFRRVSKLWNMKLSSSEYCSCMNECHFPLQWQKYCKSMAGAKRNTGNAISWFQEAALSEARRSHGRYSSMSIHHQHPRIKAHGYCKGRVALMVNNYTIEVKILQSNSSRYFVEPNREKLFPWKLSDRYLLATNVRSHTVLIWPLDDEQEMIQLHMPNKVDHVNALGSRIVIVTSSNEIFTCEVGKPLKPVNTCGPDEGLKRFLGASTEVFFHPDEPECLFILYGTSQDYTDDDLCKARLTVEKVHPINPELNSIRHLHLTRKILNRHPSPFADSLFHPGVLPLEEGSFGFYNLDSFVVEDHSLHSADSKDSHDENMMKFGSVVKFDIHTLTFDIQHYKIPKDHEVAVPGRTVLVSQVFCWRGQVIIPLCSDESEPSIQGVSNSLVLAINRQKKVKQVKQVNQNEMFPWYGKDGIDDRKIHFSEMGTASQEHGVAYCWSGATQLLEVNESGYEFEEGVEHSRMVVEGDDDFVVMFGTFGYVVWCFNKDIQLP